MLSVRWEPLQVPHIGNQSFSTHTRLQASSRAASRCSPNTIPGHQCMLKGGVKEFIMCKSGSVQYLKLTSVLPRLLFDRRDAWDSRLNWDSRLLLESRLAGSLG